MIRHVVPLIVLAIAVKVILGGVAGFAFSLAWVAFKLLCIAGAVYCALNLFAPQTARRLREKLGVDEG